MKQIQVVENNKYAINYRNSISGAYYRHIFKSHGPRAYALCESRGPCWDVIDSQRTIRVYREIFQDLI